MAAFTLSAPLTRLRTHSSFELKVKELEDLKEKVHNHLRKLNVLRIRYVDWFKNRHQTFVDSLQFIDASFHLRITAETATMENFRRYYEITCNIPKQGSPMYRCVAVFGEYLEFWDQLSHLHKEGQCFRQLMEDYSKSVTRMREPRLNDSVEQLQSRLDEEIDEKFNVMAIHLTTDQMFTYSVAQHDEIFQGLLSYIPYLLKTSSTICFLCTKMFLEEE